MIDEKRDASVATERDLDARMWRAALRLEPWALDEIAYWTKDYCRTPEEYRDVGMDDMADRLELGLVEVRDPPFMNRRPRTRAEVRAMWYWGRHTPDGQKVGRLGGIAETRAAVARHREHVRAAIDDLIRESGGA